MTTYEATTELFGELPAHLYFFVGFRPLTVMKVSGHGFDTESAQEVKQARAVGSAAIAEKNPRALGNEVAAA